MKTSRREFLIQSAALGSLGLAIPGISGASLLNAGANWKRNFSWKSITTTGAPVARTDCQGVWTGTEMIVWGGHRNSGAAAGACFNTGGKYNPTTNVWTATTTTGAPTARTGHTLTWTGTEMIVWGGSTTRNLRSPTTSGSRYNPSTDTWTAMTTTGAPSARSWHSAVWTGSRLLVWGGYDWNTSCKNDGFLYNPGTDAWTAISSTSAPVARDTHAAEWTGTQLIIWGGEDFGGNPLASGGVWTQASDTWSTITATGAPTARTGNGNSTWDDSRFLIFSGDDVSSAAVSGGHLYNPSTNTWTAMTSSGIPAARTYHQAVWTGRFFMFFGGANRPSTSGTKSTIAYNETFLYNPTGDRWIRQTTTNAPAGRDSHACVWTGRQLLVWGGNPVGQASELNTGGVLW
jgi:N-acetylneuraminic acid mutarotase